MLKNVWKKTLTLMLTGVLAVSLTACGGSGDSSTANRSSDQASSAENGTKVIRLGVVGQDANLNDNSAMAKHEGFLDEELSKAGYSLEVLSFAQAGPAINEAFAAGEIDMAVYGDLPATVAKSNGVDTKIIATTNSEMQMGFMVKKGAENEIKSSVDLKGKKIIVARGTIYHQYFKSLIKDAGINEDEVEQINTFSDATATLASGDADVLISSSQTLYYLETQGIGTVIETTEKHPEWTSQFFLVGSSSYLEENAEAAKAFIRALNKGWEYAKENPQAVYDIHAEYNEGYTADIFKKVFSYDETFSYFSPEITEAGMEKLRAMLQFLKDEGLITNDVDLDSFVDTSYYEAAKK